MIQKFSASQLIIASEITTILTVITTERFCLLLNFVQVKVQSSYSFSRLSLKFHVWVSPVSLPVTIVACVWFILVCRIPLHEYTTYLSVQLLMNIWVVSRSVSLNFHTWTNCLLLRVLNRFLLRQSGVHDWLLTVRLALWPDRRPGQRLSIVLGKSVMGVGFSLC